MRGPLHGFLTRLLPVVKSPINEISLREMLCQQLRLRFRCVRKLRHQHFCYTTMIALSRAPEEGLVGSILDERMLKGVCCLWRYTSLVDNLCLDQAVKFVLERPVVELRHRLEQCIRELSANRGTKLSDHFGGQQPV